MSEAFKCDMCLLLGREDPFNEGRPKKTLYEKDHDRGQNEVYVESLDLCEECHTEMLNNE